MSNLVPFYFYWTPLEAEPELTEKQRRIAVSIQSIAFMYDKFEKKFQGIFAHLKERENPEADPGTIGIHTSDKAINPIIGEAWEFIDWTSRLYKIISQAAGLKKKEEWYIEMAAALSEVKEFRNLLQHYDRNLNYLVKNQSPFMGTIIGWYKNTKGGYCQVFIGYPSLIQADTSINFYFLGIPQEEFKSLDQIHLSLAEHCIDIGTLYRKVSAAKERLVDYLQKEYQYEWPIV